MKSIRTEILSIIGGLSIVFGIILANNINHVYLSPLMFSLGIIFTIILGLDLITKAIPTCRSWRDCVIIGYYNLLTAFAAGVFLRWTGNFPQIISLSWETFAGAIGTGIIIGLVGLSNKEKTSYTVPVTFMLMFSFVYLKLPHCVVSAFYLGAISGAGAFFPSLLGFSAVLLGNIIGGLIIRGSYSLIKAVKE